MKLIRIQSIVSNYTNCECDIKPDLTHKLYK